MSCGGSWGNRKIGKLRRKGGREIKDKMVKYILWMNGWDNNEVNYIED